MPHHVLVVDDDASTRYVYIQVLDGLGFVIHEAASGDEALEWLGEQAPALVILDMLLPGAPGTEVLTHIYTQPRLAQTRVLIITAHQQYSRTTLREGDRVLFKPVSSHVMRQTAIDMLTVSATP